MNVNFIHSVIERINSPDFDFSMAHYSQCIHGAACQILSLYPHNSYSRDTAMDYMGITPQQYSELTLALSAIKNLREINVEEATSVLLSLIATGEVTWHTTP